MFLFIENKPKKELISVLIQRGYDSDPVKKWKESQQKVFGGLSLSFQLV